MNIKEYLKNPAGKGAVIPGKEALLDIFNRRYGTLNKTKPIDFKIYVDREIIYYHVLISTEASDRDNTYDVILRFAPTSHADINDKSIKNYEIRFFSNCPSFTYTYAYVAKLNGIIVEELVDKYNKTVLKFPPVSRNPGLIFNYEKSTYFACKFLMESGDYLSKHYIKSRGIKFTKNIFKTIRTDSVIEEEIKRSRNKAKENARAQKNEKIRNSIKNSSISSTVDHNKQNTVKKSSVNYIKPKKPIGAKNGRTRKVSTIKPINKRR